MAALEPLPSMETDSANVYLRAFLEPLAPWLERSDVSEIISNCPGEIWVERMGVANMERISVPALDDRHIQRLAGQIARFNFQAINPDHPLLAATLPGGERVQIVGPPATREHWAIAIRKQCVYDIALEDFAPRAGFGDVSTDADARISAGDQALKRLLEERRVPEFLRAAVLARKTILISGGTSAGKTSLLNALIREIPQSERIIAVEDTAEIKMIGSNSVGLIAVRGAMGRARITIEDLLQAALRMRPDRILVGEIRGPEAATFLRAINTGHPGSITTLHADSPNGALEQVALMVLQSGLPLSRADTIAYVRSIVDIIIQVDRDGGCRKISQVTLKSDSESKLTL